MRRSLLYAGILASALAAVLVYSVQRGTHLVLGVQDLSISRLPYVIAYDRGLYKKHGLNIELWIDSPSSPGTTLVRAEPLAWLWRTFGLSSLRQPHVSTNGATPMMLGMIHTAGGRREIALGSTDCVLRTHIVGRHGITSLEDLKGKRIGISGLRATPGLHALAFAQRMGWDPVQDVSFIEDGDDVALLLDNRIDAIFAYEANYAEALREGLPILADTRDWNDHVGGNSVRVEAQWARDPQNRETMRRFLMATIEGIALFHREPEIALATMQDWYRLDRETAQIYYARGAWIPRKPYPCYEGLKRTAELYDSNAMRNVSIQDFYDDSLVREIDESGFIDRLYE